jgi:hypothetical protein
MTRPLGLTLLVIAAGAALEWALGVHHVAGGHAVFGAAGCAVIVVVSKALGKRWLQRPQARDE